MRLRFVDLLTCFALLGVIPCRAQEPPKYELNIPSLPLKEALEQFSIQTELQISTDEETRSSQQITVPLAGHYSAEIALSALLGATDFVHEYTSEDSIAVRHTRALPRTRPSVTIDRETIEKLRSKSAADIIRYAALQWRSLSAVTDCQCVPPQLLINGRTIDNAIPPVSATLKYPEDIPASAIERIEIWPAQTDERSEFTNRHGAINVVINVNEMFSPENSLLMH